MPAPHRCRHIKNIFMDKISLEHLRQLAYNAHYGTSFSPEKRAQTVIDNYTDEINSDMGEIEKAAPAELSAGELQAILLRYRHSYERYLRAWLGSMTGIYSAFIAGPSNFPAERMRKRNNWADNHYKNFRQWRERALKAIYKGLRPKTDELEQALQNLNGRIRMQRIMVAANKIIRRAGPETRAELSALGLNEEQIDKVLNPKWTTHKGFLPFQLSNNSVEIRRLKERVKVLQEKKEKADTVGNITEVIKGVTLVQNFTADRVQIIFPVKPSKEICGAARSAGFIWAPSHKAWQRKLTNQAIYAGRHFLENL